MVGAQEGFELEWAAVQQTHILGLEVVKIDQYEIRPHITHLSALIRW